MSIESHPLRVLLVAARYFPYIGGMETHVYEVGRRLVCAGIEVTVLTTDVSRQLPAVEEIEGMQIRRVPAWPANRDYYFAPDIYRIIRQGSWDLIHFQGYHNLVPPLAMLAAWRANIPYVLSFHSGGDVTRLRKALRKLHWMMLRPLISRARKLIAVSTFEAKFFQERLRLPAEQFVVIPNGSAHLSQISKPPEQVANAVPLIVSIGRLVPYKGHQRVIAAMPNVLEQVPEARLRIVGIGPYESTLQKMAKQLGVDGRVEIRAVPPGDKDGMASVIAGASLVTLLSEHEAQGLAALEALTLNRPVLVAGTSALQELADCGLVQAVPLKSTPQEVARAVVRQLRQPLIPLNVRLPSWDDCTDDLLALYHFIAQEVPCES